MIPFNSLYISSATNKDILINRQLTMQAAADATGYNMQYLSRLWRSGKLEGVKIRQMWLRLMP